MTGDRNMTWYYYPLAAYAVIINIIAVILTVHDKNAARRHKRRIPESTLLLTAALSGCIVMYITMRIIHHKTRHKKFMIGIPVIFLLELSTVVAAVYFFSNWDILRISH